MRELVMNASANTEVTSNTSAKSRDNFFQIRGL